MRKQKGEQIKSKEIIFSEGENSAVKCALNYNFKKRSFRVLGEPCAHNREEDAWLQTNLLTAASFIESWSQGQTATEMFIQWKRAGVC